MSTQWTEPTPEQLAEGTVAEMTGAIQQIQSIQKLEAAMEAERAGKNRQSAIEALESRIAELSLPEPTGAADEPAATAEPLREAKFMKVMSKSQDGFWRCGMHFTREGTLLDLAALPQDVLDRLLEEVNLDRVFYEEDPREKCSEPKS